MNKGTILERLHAIEKRQDAQGELLKTVAAHIGVKVIAGKTEELGSLSTFDEERIIALVKKSNEISEHMSDIAKEEISEHDFEDIVATEVQSFMDNYDFSDVMETALDNSDLDQKVKDCVEENINDSELANTVEALEKVVAKHTAVIGTDPEVES